MAKLKNRRFQLGRLCEEDDCSGRKSDEVTSSWGSGDSASSAGFHVVHDTGLEGIRGSESSLRPAGWQAGQVVMSDLAENNSIMKC